MCPLCKLVTQKHSLAILSIFLGLDKDVAIIGALLHDKSSRKSICIIIANQKCQGMEPFNM